MARYRLASTQSWTLVFLAFASMGLGTTGLMSQENPRPIAQGGLIQQLRSFTQDTFGSGDFTDGSVSANQKPQPNYLPPTPAKSIPRPSVKQGARTVPANNQSKSWLDRFISRRAPEEDVPHESAPRYTTRERTQVAAFSVSNEGVAHAEAESDDLPQVITPSELRGQRKSIQTQPSSLRSTKPSGEVFVEHELPERVRRSLYQSEPDVSTPSTPQAEQGGSADVPS